MTVLSPEYIEPDASDTELLGRIYDSYVKMKEHEQDAPALYRPSSMWRAHLDDGFSNMLEARERGSLDTFAFFLANFGAWKTDLGIESTWLVQQHASTAVLRRKLTRETFWPQFQAWRNYWSDERPLSRLSYPRFGNQAGAVLSSGEFIGPGSFWNDIYGSMLGEMVAGLDRPLIAELGAGYGKLAYFTLRDIERFTYVDVDLPEVLSTAAFYLMKAFPDRRTLLFGEEKYSRSSHDQFDLIFMPPWVIEDMGSASADLFLNKNSLGEISNASANNYVAHIVRATRGLFFHMNHERDRNYFDDGSTSLLNREYPIPRDSFRQLVRYPDVGHLIFLRTLDIDSDIFFYLYQRLDATRS